jgi:hypothetical protein
LVMNERNGGGRGRPGGGHGGGHGGGPRGGGHRRLNRKPKGRPIDGWLIVDKPSGIGSTDVVNKVKRLFDAQKAGHGGTLDPLATGLLPVAFGAATKTVPYVMDGTKTYRFTLRFGEARDTDDADGKVIATSDARPTDEQINAANLPGGAQKLIMAEIKKLYEVDKRIVPYFPLVRNRGDFWLRIGQGKKKEFSGMVSNKALGTSSSVVIKEENPGFTHFPQQLTLARSAKGFFLFVSQFA